MPRNGSGQYIPLTNTWNPPVTGVLATGADFQAQLTDIAAAITQSFSKDGQTPMTGSLPMNNNSIIGVAAGTAAAPSIAPTGDNNTGVYFPAADQVAISTGGTQRVVVSNSGLGVNNIASVTGANTAQINGFTPSASNMTGCNKIINGKMDIAQRGTSFAAAVDGAYALDRWSTYIFGGGGMTATQETDVPTNNQFQNSLRLTVTTPDTSIAAGDYAGVLQIIEGYNVVDLIGRTFTLSFWVRSSKIGVHCVGFNNSSQDRSYITEYNINTANTWEFKTVTVNGGLITSGGWNWTDGKGLLVYFAMAIGSTFQSTANTWKIGNFTSTANQVNCLDTVGNIFAITGVQLEAGEVATPFEHRLYGQELALCQRYYQSLVLKCLSSDETVRYLVPMRTYPTVDFSDFLGSPMVVNLSSQYLYATGFVPGNFSEVKLNAEL